MITPADVIRSTADLIEARGLCLTDHIAASDAYEVGFAALWVLVSSLGYEMDDEGEEPWDSEMLANHVAYWLHDARPTSTDVLEWMREVAARQDTHVRQVA